jgi:diadenosine tetraphosphate (Ap4A) HIT family hydrolase
MDVIDVVRDAMLKTLKIKKVYLLYMDEVKHVHWHLIPRYNEKGLNVLEEKPKRLLDTDLAKLFKRNLRLRLK